MALRSDMTYQSPSAKETFNLGSGPARRYGRGDAMRSREWSYSLGYRGITNVYRGARKVKQSLTVRDLAFADRMAGAFDEDVLKGTPGTVEVGRWRQRAYVVGSETRTATDGLVDLTLTIVLLDGMWRIPHELSFRPVGSSMRDGKGYPLAYPYSYGYSEGMGHVPSVGALAGPVSLTVYGPATNPSVTVGGNRYQVRTSVPSGGYLVIDGIEATVTLVSEWGTRTNALADAVRGTGKGSGEYIFEEVGGNGDVPVTWDGSFGFDLTWWEQAGEPSWT